MGNYKAGGGFANLKVQVLYYFVLFVIVIGTLVTCI